jgi:anti-sigma factor ChrR (cupin superfamily)
MAGRGGDCICLIAEQAPVVLKGPVGAVLNKLTALAAR